jgi:hypothetical protein
LPSLAEFATLNEAPQQLFNRGAMKSEGDFESANESATTDGADAGTIPSE